VAKTRLQVPYRATEKNPSTIFIKDVMSNQIDDNHEVIEVPYVDKRSFTDKIFFNLGEDGPILKKVALYDASLEEPEEFPNDILTVLINYKKGIIRGRKDPLKGQDIIVLKTEKGPYYVPLSEAKAFAARIYSLAEALEKKKI